MHEQIQRKITVLAALLIGYAIIGLAIGGFVFLILTTVAISSGDSDALFILSAIGTGILALFAIDSLPSLIAGVALLKGATWSRMVTIIASAINIFFFPFGTALAIYAIIVLSNPEVAVYLDSGGDPDGSKIARRSDSIQEKTDNAA